MPENDPYEQLTDALHRRARGERLSPQQLAKIAVALQNSGLAECENAQAILVSLYSGDSYVDAVKRTAVGGTMGYGD